MVEAEVERLWDNLSTECQDDCGAHKFLEKGKSSWVADLDASGVATLDILSLKERAEDSRRHLRGVSGVIPEERVSSKREKSPLVAALEESGVATWDILSLKERTKYSRRHHGGVSGGSQWRQCPPKEKNHLRYLTWRSLGLLPGMSGCKRRSARTLGDFSAESKVD